MTILAPLAPEWAEELEELYEDDETLRIYRAGVVEVEIYRDARSGRPPGRYNAEVRVEQVNVTGGNGTTEVGKPRVYMSDLPDYLDADEAIHLGAALDAAGRRLQDISRPTE